MPLEAFSEQEEELTEVRRGFVSRHSRIFSALPSHRRPPIPKSRKIRFKLDGNMKGDKRIKSRLKAPFFLPGSRPSPPPKPSNGQAAPTPIKVPQGKLFTSDDRRQSASGPSIPSRPLRKSKASQNRSTAGKQLIHKKEGSSSMENVTTRTPSAGTFPNSQLPPRPAPRKKSAQKIAPLTRSNPALSTNARVEMPLVLHNTLSAPPRQHRRAPSYESSQIYSPPSWPYPERSYMTSTQDQDLRKFAPLAASALISSSDFVKKTEYLSRNSSVNSISSLVSLEMTRQLEQQKRGSLDSGVSNSFYHSSSEPNLVRIYQVPCHNCSSSLTQLHEEQSSSDDYSESDDSDYTYYDTSEESEPGSVSPMVGKSKQPKQRRISMLVEPAPAPVTKSKASRRVSSTPLHSNSVVSICNQESIIIDVVPYSDYDDEYDDFETPPSVSVSETPYMISAAKINKSRARLSRLKQYGSNYNRSSRSCCVCCTGRRSMFPLLCFLVIVIVIVFIVLIDMLPKTADGSR